MAEIIAISLPKGFCKKVDGMRGDVSRSRFIYRLLEKAVEPEIEE
jgi:hypothetical protein